MSWQAPTHGRTAGYRAPIWLTVGGCRDLPLAPTYAERRGTAQCNHHADRLGSGFSFLPYGRVPVSIPHGGRGWRADNVESCSNRCTAPHSRRGGPAGMAGRWGPALEAQLPRDRIPDQRGSECPGGG